MLFRSISQLEAELEILQNQKYEEPNYKKIIDDYLSFEEPDRILLLQIIDKIEISEDGTTDIYFKYNLNNTTKIDDSV